MSCCARRCRPSPFRTTTRRNSPAFLDVDGARVPYFDQTVWAGIATLNGLPATTAPIGRAANGLPIGAPVIGGFLDDPTTIASAS